jgi:hypothetical protein
MNVLLCTSPVWIGVFLIVVVFQGLKYTSTRLSEDREFLIGVTLGVLIMILNILWSLIFSMVSYEYIFDFWILWLAVLLVFVVFKTVSSNTLRWLSQRQGLLIGTAVFISMVCFLRLPYVLAKIEVENTIISLGFLELAIDINDSNRRDVYREVWLRDMVPPSTPDCFSQDPSVCYVVDFIEDYPELGSSTSDPYSYYREPQSTSENLMDWLLSFLGRWLILGVLVAVWVWWFLNYLIWSRLETNPS